MSEQFQRVKLTIDGDVVGEAKEPKGFYAEAEDGSRDGGFRNQDAMVNAMADPRYKVDAEYRRAVQELVTRTSTGILTGTNPEVHSVNSGDTIERSVETAQALFGDPRYAKSASFRAQVAQAIAAQGKNDGTTRLQAMGSPEGAHRVSFDMNASVDPMGVHRATASDGEEGDN